MNENENPIAPNMGAETNANPEMPVEQNNGNFTPTEPVTEAVPMQAAAAAMPVQAEAAATEAMPMAEPTPMVNPAATATVPEKKSGSKTGLLIAIIAALLLIGGGVALAILKPWEDNAKKPANTANVNNGGDENDTKSENENDGTGDAGSIENNQRFQDLNKFMAAMVQYQVNNSNKLPNDWSESGSFIKHYILVDGAMPKNEDGQEYVFISGMVVESDAKDEPLDSYDANAQKRNIYVFTNAKCGSDDGSISYSANKLDVAMVGVDKDMNVLCSDNQ